MAKATTLSFPGEWRRKFAPAISFAILLAVGLSLSVLIYLGQYSLLFGILILFVLVVTFLIAPPLGIMLLLILSTMTGFFDRIAFYLAGGTDSRDFIRASIESAVLLIAVFELKRHTKAIHNRVTRGVDALVWAYFILSTLQTFNIFSSSLMVTLWGWRWECLPILMYLIGRNQGMSEKMIIRFYRTLILLSLILAAYAVYQAVFGLPAFDQLWLSKLPEAQRADLIAEGSMFISGKFRLFSMTVGHSYYTFLSSYLFIWILFTPRIALSRRFRILQALALVLTGIYLLLSLERSAVGIIAIGILTVLGLRAQRKLGLLSVILAVLLILGIASLNTVLQPVANQSVVGRRLLELTHPFTAATVTWRITTVWPQALQAIARNPLGYGLGTSQNTSVNVSQNAILPHNNYFRIALESGIIGLGIFLLLWGSYLLLLFKAYKLNIHRSLVAGSFASLLPILALAVVNNPFENPLSLFIWFSTGITLSQIALACSKKNEA